MEKIIAIVGSVVIAGAIALVVSHKIQLSAIESELKTLETKAQGVVAIAVADVKSFIAAIRAKL